MKIENYFLSWETKVRRTSSLKMLTGLQLEFNQETFHLLEENILKDISDKERQKVLNTFKSKHSSINYLIITKIHESIE